MMTVLVLLLIWPCTERIIKLVALSGFRGRDMMIHNFCSVWILMLMLLPLRRSSMLSVLLLLFWRCGEHFFKVSHYWFLALWSIVVVRFHLLVTLICCGSILMCECVLLQSCQLEHKVLIGSLTSRVVVVVVIVSFIITITLVLYIGVGRVEAVGELVFVWYLHPLLLIPSLAALPMSFLGLDRVMVRVYIDVTAPLFHLHPYLLRHKIFHCFLEESTWFDYLNDVYFTFQELPSFDKSLLEPGRMAALTY